MARIDRIIPGREIWAIVKIGDEVRTATTGTMSLGRLGVQDGAVFHLYGIALGAIVLTERPEHRLRWPRDGLGRECDARFE